MILDIGATTTEEHLAFIERTHHPGTVWAYRESGNPDDLLRVLSREDGKIVYSWYRGIYDDLSEHVGSAPLGDFRVDSWHQLVEVTEAEWIEMLLSR